VAFLCLGCFTTSLLKKFDSPKWRPVRGGMFMFAGLSAIATFLAILVNPSPYKMQWNAAWYALGGYIFIQGALLYVFRIPERCKPGAFDLCGASHQLFHFAVLIGLLMFY
jgi:adiponectin receptor